MASDVLIIGGGVAGLSAGIYAQLNGLKATICELHSKLGGCLTSWNRNGFHIDNCVHWLTGTNPHDKLNAIWHDLNVLGDSEIYNRDYLFYYDGIDGKIELKRNVDEFRDNLLEIAPEDKKEILSLMKAIDTVQGYFGYAGENCDEKFSIPKLISRFPILMKYNKLSIKELSERFNNKLLRKFIRSFMPEYFASLTIIYVMGCFLAGDADIPYGGSEAIAKRMEDRFISLGGKVLLNKEAVHLNINGKNAESVLFKDGETIYSDNIILAMDPASAFEKLGAKGMPKVLQSNYKKMKRFSSYHAAYTCEEDKLPFKGDVTIDVPKEYRDELKANYLLLRNDSHEQDYAPKGKSLIQVMVYCSEDKAKDFIELKSSDIIEYKNEKNKIGDIILGILSVHFPSLKNNIKTLDIWTPATYKRYVNSQMGSFMGFALMKNQFPFLVKNKLSGLNNVYLASQWLQAPGGLPIAAESGKRAVECIIKNR